MATILCLETATTNCSVALSVNGSICSLREDRSEEYSHGERLHVFIEEVLHMAGMDKTALDAVAVSKGPGSYTGLRIGVSAAKGICYALDIPLLAIATLRMLAQQAGKAAPVIISMLDARRMEVYAAVFSSSLETLRDTRAEVLSEDSYFTYLDEGKVAFIGSGITKFKPLCRHANAVFIEDKIPSALQMASLAEAAYNEGNTEDVAYFEPFYLKDFNSH